ncbi:MAG TPA: helix-turn-helix domain-containing protein [Candidatus Eisenbacteria bacterium]|nr:helix-turn-helix domain-containing protein [Candidatus Eisenbacteria bacterium]
MAARAPLSLAEKERLYAAKIQGRSLPSIAAELGCSTETARKWWRLARDHGRAAFHQARRGRAATGVLSRFAPAVSNRALTLKRDHPSWGSDRVLADLMHDPTLSALPLPSRSRLALLFKTECPELVAPRRARTSPPPAPAAPRAVHECWQLDFQEASVLADDHRASICTLRDPVGAAILASQAFDITGGERGRRLRWEEVRGVIRTAFARWATLPDALQTDNEVCLGGQPSDPLPSQLTLWLVGLGVAHRFIRPNTPTDQAQIERTHRTLDGFVGLPDSQLDLARLQQRLDAEREVHNAWFPSRASDCGGRPPLLAHPELLLARRPYQVEWERALFNEQRVYAYLATIVLSRKVSKTGQIQLSGQSRSVGRACIGQTVTVQCDALRRDWVVRVADGTVVKRLSIRGLDVTSLTGLPDTPTEALLPIQLTLPLAA